MILEARDVGFAYAGGRTALDGVSIAVSAGTMTALIGPNGCGKSTFLRILSGVLRPIRGSVVYRDLPLAKWEGRELAKKLAYVPQNASQSFPFTSLEVVLTGRTPYRSPFRLENHADLERAREALAAVGVAHLAERRITELSGGERQLVSVARALAQDPECLLLDEPSSSLDLKHRAALIRLLNDLRRSQGLTVLMVTHDLMLLDPGFDWIYAMRHGQIAASGAPVQVMREQVLAEVYDDPHIRARRVNGQTCVWSEVRPQ
jgi:iron complex transport system ATP-binding protein